MHPAPRLLIPVLAAILASVVARGESRVEVIHVPGAANVKKAQTGPDGVIHLLYDADDGPRYVKSTDHGGSFSAPIPVVDASSRKPGLQYITWDMAIDRDGGVHVALGNNAWQLKLPPADWGFFYAKLAPGAPSFTTLRNLNHKPSEGFSIAANGRGAVTASFLSGRLYSMSSLDGGANFGEYAELNPSIEPCKCCTTSTAFGADGRLAVLYREESNNDRDIYLILENPDVGGASLSRTRISGAPWKLEGCPMTYFTVQPTATGYLAAWPTKGEIYFARLDRNGAVLPPGEIKTPGRCGMRTGIVALEGKDGTALVVWKNQETLGWQCFDAQGQAVGTPGSAPSRGSGAAAVVLPDGKFAVFP